MTIPAGLLCDECTCCPAVVVLPDNTALCARCDDGNHPPKLDHSVDVNEMVAEPVHSHDIAAEFLEEPAASPDSPNQEEPAMPETKCLCGCGSPVSSGSKSGYARGHHKRAKTGRTLSKRVRPTALDVVGEIAIDPPAEDAVTVELTASQIERIWSLLPIEEKALGLVTALTAERNG